MPTFLLGVSAVVPSILLVWYFHSRDAYPEPPRVLWMTFLWGILVTVPILVVALPMDYMIRFCRDFYVYGALSAFLTAAIPEELGKLAVLTGYSMRSREFDEPMDGVVYGAVASLGFATLENVLYVTTGGSTVAIMRALTAVPAHSFLGAIMGYYAGRAKYSPESRSRLLFTGWAIATLLHGLYDTPLLTIKAMSDGIRGHLPEGQDGAIGLLLLCGIAIFIVEWRWAIVLVRRAQQGQRIMMAAPLRNLPVATIPVVGTHGSGLWGAALAFFGGIMASAGGMVLLAVSLAFVIGRVEIDDQMNVAIGAVIIGLLPTLVGILIFMKGVTVLNRPAAVAIR